MSSQPSKCSVCNSDTRATNTLGDNNTVLCKSCKKSKMRKLMLSQVEEDAFVAHMARLGNRCLETLVRTQVNRVECPACKFRYKHNVKGKRIAYVRNR